MTIEKPRPTIDLVAEKAKVSKATISRFLNGRFEHMSDKTRIRIQRVIDEMDYRPSRFARSLKSNKTGLIGVIIADISTPFSSILVKGIEDLCSERGYQIIIASANEDPERERAAIRSMIDGNMVEGLIVNTTGYNHDFLVEMAGRGIPMVLVARAMEDLLFDTVTNDNYSITWKMLSHLENSGFQRVAFFTEAVGASSSQRTRLEAYMDFCDRDGHNPQYVYPLDLKDQSAINTAITSFLNSGESGPKAIFAYNGVTVLRVLVSIGELGLTIPEDVGVCCIDDWEWLVLSRPGITAAAVPTYEEGVVAAKRVIARIKGTKSKPRMIELPSVLNVRGSTQLSRN